MPFFNGQNPVKLALQTANLILLSTVAYNMVHDPEFSDSELGIDIAVHVLTTVSLKCNSAILDLIASAANAARLGMICHGVATGSSSYSRLNTILDTINHLMNSGIILSAGIGEPEKSTKKQMTA